ncbi:MAG: hypothetical protein GY749_06860 [Desulfobacteraceae bacterium]|nr:hypothetical protein [Desulfobacteraceae bacterium]MCP4348553.1 hypothetical protein [Desulfobacterales bacterium]
MKKSTIIIAVAIAFTIAFSVQGFTADEHDHGSHKAAQEKGHSEHTKSEHKTGHSKHMGEKIHESDADGFKLVYELIDMREKMKDMPAGMKATHHLMVYVKDSHGHNFEKAKVGYLVEGPGGSKQKLMCMGMAGGFGSDVNFSEKGTYTVKTKVAAGDKKLMDKFEYEVK